jgi:hypothetical protein
MKRDMNLIRLLLLRSEGDQVAKEKCDKFPNEERAFHVQLMIDAGLVDGVVDINVNGKIVSAVVWRLTWDGYEFLESIRDESIWNKVKSKVIKPGASWTFTILKELIKCEIQKTIAME